MSYLSDKEIVNEAKELIKLTTNPEINKSSCYVCL